MNPDVFHVSRLLVLGKTGFCRVNSQDPCSLLQLALSNGVASKRRLTRSCPTWSQCRESLRAVSVITPEENVIRWPWTLRRIHKITESPHSREFRVKQTWDVPFRRDTAPRATKTRGCFPSSTPASSRFLVRGLGCGVLSVAGYLSIYLSILSILSIYLSISLPLSLSIYIYIYIYRCYLSLSLCASVGFRR